MANENEDKNNSSSIPGFLMALAGAGAAAGAAVYLNNKSKKLTHIRRYTQFYDVKSMKQISFFPNHLKHIRSLPTSSVSKKDFVSLLKIFKIEHQELINTIVSSPNTSKALENADSKITIIRCLLVQNIKLLTELSNISIEELKSIDSTVSINSDKERRSIVWFSFCLSALEPPLISQLIPILRSLDDLFSNNFSSNLNEKSEIVDLFSILTTALNKEHKGEQENDKQILNDIKRTFFVSSNEVSSRETDPLLNIKRLILGTILKVYCSTEEAYCQGMNNVVGFIINIFYSSNSNLNDHKNVLLKSFIMFYSLMKGYHFNKIYDKGLIGLHYGQLCIEKILSDNAPYIYKDMIKQEVIPLSWSVQWFLTLFTYTFKYKDVERIWDGIFMYGFLYVIKTAGSIIKIVERVKIKDKDELNKVISEFPKNFNLDMRLFINMVNKFPITYREIKKFIDGIPLEDESVVGMTMKDLGFK